MFILQSVKMSSRSLQLPHSIWVDDELENTRSPIIVKRITNRDSGKRPWLEGVESGLVYDAMVANEFEAPSSSEAVLAKAGTA